MRHVTGFFLALVLSAALFFGTGGGIAKFSAMHTGSGTPTVSALTSPHSALPLGALLGTGLLLGIMLAVRAVSALATGLPGLVLLGWSALVLLRGKQALNYVPLPGSHYAVGFASLLASGAFALAGAVMIIPLFMPSRWHSAVAEVEDLEDDYQVSAALGLVP